MYDLIVLCDGSRVAEIADDLDIQFCDEDSFSILWSGKTKRYGLGIVVIECEHELTKLIQELKNDAGIFDLIGWFEVPTYYEGSKGSVSPSIESE